MRITILLMILCLVIAACGAPQETTQPATQNEQVNAQVEEQVDAPTTQDDHETEDASAFEEFTDLFSMKMKLEYQVDYEMTTTTNGQTQEMQMAQYVKGDQIRSDVEFDGIESQTYMTGSSIISCTNDGEWMCIEMEMESSSPIDDLEEQIETNVQAGHDMNVEKLPSRTVAGTSTNCFRVETDDGSVDYCLTKEGIPLYVESSGTSDSTTYDMLMEATSYSTSVPNSAFTPPAEPSQMPSFDSMGEMDEDAMADLIAQYS